MLASLQHASLASKCRPWKTVLNDVWLSYPAADNMMAKGI
jgi:hypothetical protein